MNAYAECWVQSIKQECLDHFIVFGQSHLDHLVHEYLTYCLIERPHQSLHNRPLTQVEAPEDKTVGEIDCTERLGGLLKHYHRQAS
jgi:putative transposase